MLLREFSRLHNSGYPKEKYAITGPRLNGCDNKSLRTKKLLPTEKLAFPAGVSTANPAPIP
jgi:hypothetical protein